MYTIPEAAAVLQVTERRLLQILRESPDRYPVQTEERQTRTGLRTGTLVPSATLRALLLDRAENGETDTEANGELRNENGEMAVGEQEPLVPPSSDRLATLESRLLYQEAEISRLTTFATDADALLGELVKAVRKLEQAQAARSPIGTLASALRTMKWPHFTVRRRSPGLPSAQLATQEGRPAE